ncbi:MAG: VOC family protein [Paraglaciecola sp.]|uniref:VOC family protein n=1 Tax=Paraglaciecola sp. TaxID=1920173 RepID=UPI003264E717
MSKMLYSCLFICLLSFNALAKNEILTDGFNHIGLTVKDLESSTNFFTDTLGWNEVGGDPSYPAKFVSDGKIFLTLWQTTAGQNTIEFNRKHNVGLHHLALTAVSFEALDELYERFKEVEGVVIEFAPELAYGGPTKHMMIREPSGNRLEFTFNPKN